MPLRGGIPCFISHTVHATSSSPILPVLVGHGTLWAAEPLPPTFPASDVTALDLISDNRLQGGGRLFWRLQQARDPRALVENFKMQAGSTTPPPGEVRS